MTNSEVVNDLAPVQAPNRPQKLNPPFPYCEEEVSYENTTDGVTLSGTLTKPSEGERFPVVVLVSGIGPNDRNYTMLDHEPFLLLADHLTRNGIAVLRVDKRGVGTSTGTFNTAVTSEDLARDVQAGIDYLKTRDDIQLDQIGLLGHSEGGLIASMVAAERDDIAFLLLMAGVVTTYIEDVVYQVAMQLRADGASREMLKADSKVRRQLLRAVIGEADPVVAEAKMKEIVASYIGELPEELKEESEDLVFTIKESGADKAISFLNSPCYRYLLRYNPTNALERITIPVLALNGDLDFITSSKSQFPVLAQALSNADNDNFTLVEVPKANHWFQTAETGSTAEYGSLEETMSPAVLTLISDWIAARVS